jgi:tRNA (guanosine-2'-O-)-methyltransferase
VEPARRQRIEAVLAQRIDTVRCAIEAVHHRHNISAILRSCDALGLSHVHLVEGHFTPSKGTTRGAERWLALHRHASPADAIAELRAAGFAIWVADFADPPVPPERVPVDRPVCLWFGAELIGVGPAARAAADGVVTIPMRGFAQSLNVSVAAAVTLRAVAERSREILGDRALLPSGARDALRQRWLERELAIDAAADAVDTALSED